MGDEADVLAKLSRVLETQSLGFNGSEMDSSSVGELMAKIGGELGDVTVGSEGGGFQTSMLNAKVQMPNRKTPYEVWAEGQQKEAVRVSTGGIMRWIGRAVDRSGSVVLCVPVAAMRLGLVLRAGDGLGRRPDGWISSFDVSFPPPVLLPGLLSRTLPRGAAPRPLPPSPAPV
jgi:hypothetical protein